MKRSERRAVDIGPSIKPKEEEPVMGWFSKDERETANNEVQADGAKAGMTDKSHYIGTLSSVRSNAEQQGYNAGYEHGETTIKK